MSQLDIRIGTLVGVGDAPRVIPQILPHGFESFGLTYWQTIGNVNIEETAKKVADILGDKARIGAYGLFCNPLKDPSAIPELERVIDTAHLFGTNIVNGFAGALEDRPVDQSMDLFKKVWTPLAKRAEDKGVKIAFENCDMGGTWERPAWNIAHSPTAWEMIFDAIPSPALGLEWEPCHQMNSLIDPLPQLRKWIKKIWHVHGKDATVAWDIVKEYGIRGGKPYVWHRTPGFGDTNWTDVISILRMHKWTGSIDIEGFHDPVYRGELEYTGQVYGLNYLKACRGGAFVPNPK